MSYDVSLEKAKTGETLIGPRHSEGGTHALGGTDLCELNVTYNYSGHFRKALGYSFRDLAGKTAADTVPDLQRAIAELGTTRDRDYWASTPGNAGAALDLMLAWAVLHPSGVWRID